MERKVPNILRSAICGVEPPDPRFPSAVAHSLRTVPTADEVCSLLRTFRFVYATEDELQQGLAEALASLGLDPEREVRLGSAGRIDLLVDGVGIEVKVASTPARVIAQLERYSLRPEIKELVLVTTRARHQAPLELNGKTVRVFRVRS